ncbi:MAG: AAA family ATPase [Saprospiraceae bacterium]|nr:AAA family ATPase [Saprospiraceae bacterium]
MSLLAHFPATTALTADQRSALEALQAFMAADGPDAAQVFVLRGYAGTGKTFLMQGVAAWLRAAERTVLFAAPTNRAAKVLQYRTGTEVLTLHRLLYEYADGEHRLMGRPEHFGDAPVLVVDESSLLADFTPEGADMRFGSGQLLTDLLLFLQLDRFPGTRIVFVGDPAQLPPVGMRYSPALSDANLRRLTRRPVAVAELTTVVRQQADNGILTVAHAMREAIAGRDFQPRLPLERVREVRLCNGSLLLDKYFERSPERPSGRQIILAHSNEAIRAYNREVRARYFPEAQDRVAAGDFLLVTNNLYGLETPLTNGELVQVVQTGALEKRTVRAARSTFKPVECPLLAFTEREVIGEFHFRDALVAVRTGDGQVRQLAVKVLENWLLAGGDQPFPAAAQYLLNRIAYDRFFEANRALYYQDRERFKSLRKQYARTDLYANALRCRFGYAITCHKAQGGEWDFAYVDMCAQMTRDSAEFYRWSYTAITRAKKRVYLRLNPR